MLESLFNKIADLRASTGVDLRETASQTQHTYSVIRLS